MDKQHFPESIEPFESIFFHRFHICLLEAKDDEVSTSRFVLDGLNGTRFMGHMFDVLLGNWQTAFDNAGPQELFLFRIFPVVEEKYADVRFCPIGMPLQDVGKQDHQAGILGVFWGDPQVDVVLVAKLPSTAAKKCKVQASRRQQ